ncbi:MAG: cytochrome c3 family protein [Desulfobacterales bacterium]
MEIIWKIDPWLNNGMNSDTERTGCYYCHGTVLKTEDGELSSDCWPNVGVGRVNLDGSLGSCTSCHTRHRFSPLWTASPEACGQCHLSGPSPDRNLHRVQTRRYLCRIRG